MPDVTKLLAAAFACALSQCAPEPAAVTTRKPLRIGIDLWAGYYPLVLADELGYLRDANVEVDIVTPQNTDRMLAEFAARDFDAVCVSFADVIVVTRAVPDLRIVLVSDESAGADQMLARTAITGAGGLHAVATTRRPRIGTNLGGFGELFVRRFLTAQGVSMGDVEIVNTDAAKVPDLLERGDIDIGHTWEPYASDARRRGMQAVFTSKETPGLILDGMIFRGDTVNERSDEVRALVHAWFRAVEWWRQHPEAGDRRLEKRLNLLPGDARPVGITILDAQQNRTMMSGAAGPAPLATGLQVFIDHFAARGLLLWRPDALALLHPFTLP